MQNLDPSRRRFIRLRMGLLSSIMGLALGAIVASAYRVQVEDGARWRETAARQRQRRLHVVPKRGSVVDRNGVALAVSVEVPSVSVDVVELLHGIDDEGAQGIALEDAGRRVAVALSLDEKQTTEKLRSRRRFIWLKRRVTGEEVTAIQDLGDPKKQAHPLRGISVEGEGHRYYPGRQLLGPALGFVAPDGQGKDGLELSLDEDLRGHVEEVKGLRDRGGRLVFEGADESEHALAGHDITLTIDLAIQHVAEREIDAAMGTYETKTGSVVVVDPQTGEIYAMASAPGYNPNDYAESEVESRRDRVVTDRFEPGSVMKVFTLATALGQGTLKPTDSVFCEHGTYQVGNVTIHDTHQNDWLSPTQVLSRSSNIGALKIGLAMGEPALYAGLRRFGFGETTGIPLPGEAGGVLRPMGRPWFDVETANASFGQGISVTALQLAMAMAAIANGGKLLEPLLVKRVTDDRGTVLRESATHVRREATSPAVAKLLSEMLTAVTEEGGTGAEAAIPGFHVAGKTGTAQKTEAGTRKYSADKYVASFIGFVPAERPRLVVAVVLEEPTIGHYGGDLAGPVFRRIAEASLGYLGVAPSAVRSSDVARAKDTADATLAAMTPVPPQPGALSPVEGGIPVPDATGLAARDAVHTLLAAGLVPQIEGTGRVVRQNPPAASVVAKGSAVRLTFEPSS